MYKILVVDDDLAFLKAASEFLKHAGYSVVTGRDGQEALRMVKEEKPDLMVLDVRMPGLTGYEVAHYIKYNPSFDSTLPIILYTVEDRIMDEEMSVLLGVDYLNKTSSFQALVDRIGKTLSKKDVDVTVIQKELKDIHFKGFFEHDKHMSEGIKKIIEFRIQKTLQRDSEENKYLDD